MKPQTSEEKSALHDAWRALSMIDVRVQRDFFGSVEGIDTIDIGLDMLASTFERLFHYPRAENEGTPKIDAVLAYLASQRRIEDAAVRLVTKVMEAIGQATYSSLTDAEIRATEAARSELHSHLEELLSEVEKERVNE